jgi:tetratricopeptide (TPR) repeat protein
LHELAQRAKSAALRAEIEDALDAMKARMELLGEEAPPLARSAHTFDTAKRTALVKRKDPAVVRVRARFYQILGQMLLALGARARGIARLEAAAALLPDSPSPVLGVAMSYARSSDSAQALAGFRRVLGIDRNAIEDNPSAVRMLAQAFLRRAEAMEREGRDDIARGLLEEALSIDLRKAPSDLRFALEQRLQALQSRAA